MNKNDSETRNEVVWQNAKIEKSERAKLKKQTPTIIWLTGLPGSGKSTLAFALDQYLTSQNYHTYVLDGDNIRHGLNKDLGFSSLDRTENVRRVGEVAKLFLDAGLIVIVALISPFKTERDLVRKMVEDREFTEVYVSTPLPVCESRDPKGLYKKARSGALKNFTGIDSVYEPPDKPEVTIDTSNATIDACVKMIFTKLDI